MKSKIYYSKPSITELEISYANDAVTNGWGDRMNDYIYRFEEKFKKHLDVKYAISTSSCTGALHMGMSALGIGSGDEIILADINWIASVAPIVHLGATPVFVDILPDTWCIDPKKVEQSITSKTKAIIATHLYGNLCEMEQLLAISKKYEIPVIEDSAEALGSVYYNKRAGSMAKFGTFSFHGSKTLTTGEGGMFVTNDFNLYKKVLMISNHGRNENKKKLFWSDRIGFKYKISNIQAAIGCAQLERVDEIFKRKREIFLTYKKNFSNLDGIQINPEPKGTINGAWMPTIVFDLSNEINCEKLLEVFKNENIDVRRFFWPLSSFPMFKSIAGNKHSYSISKRAINLPSYHDMKTSDIDRVVAIIRNVLGTN